MDRNDLSAVGVALRTFGVPRLRRSDEVAESMSQPCRAGLKFGYRPSGPRSDSTVYFQVPTQTRQGWADGLADGPPGLAD
jgi:hypothetical protein